jgi:hypothetical protein
VASDHDEILRLRDRLHELDGTVAGLVYRQRTLEAGVERLGVDVRALTAAVAELSNADKIAQAVTAAVRNDRKHTFTIWQKIAAALVTLIVAAPSVSHIVGWLP